MAFKNFVPQPLDAGWEKYWRHLEVGEDVQNCQTDGLLPILLQYLPKKGFILEAGCGLGKWVIFLSKMGYNIAGVDSYKQGIEKIKSFDPTLKVAVADVEKLPYVQNSLDAYLSFGVIEHWENGPHKPLSEACRVLKKDGIAIIETPCDSPLQKMTRLVKSLKSKVLLPAKIFVSTLGLRPKRPDIKTVFYEYHYSPGELTSLISRAGFKIVKTFPKDDVSPERSLGLWLDFPFLRKSHAPEFSLNQYGKLIKKLLLPFPWFWSYCVVVVAKKI